MTYGIFAEPVSPGDTESAPTACERTVFARGGCSAAASAGNAAVLSRADAPQGLPALLAEHA